MYELEAEHSSFEISMCKLLGLKIKELEEMDLFTLNLWIEQERERIIREKQEEIFRTMENNGRTHN